MPARREWLRPELLIRLAMLAVVALVAWMALRAMPTFSPTAWLRPKPAVITHQMVVDRVEDVAKLVTTEMTVRDVVTYEQTRFGMRKRALLVVTGKVLAGIDLKKGTDVRIDSVAHVITITLPPAEILAVDVTDVRTYDESAGIFNPFRPGDRDEIHRRVRNQLVSAGQRSGLLAQASKSARTHLGALLARDGWRVVVHTPARLDVAPAR
jgi:hypothetical protein